MRVAVLGLFAVAGIAVAVAWGVSALVVYAALLALAAGFTFAAAGGGNWIRDVSRRRFDDPR